jgi:hypothetical protein
MSESLSIGGVLALLALICSGMWLFRIVRRPRERRRRGWRVQLHDACVGVAALSKTLSRLMQHVPEGTHWADDGWSEGERKAEELSRSIERLGTRVPGAAQESLWNLVASLRALVIAIGDDPHARAEPTRADIIKRRLVDLGPATRSLELAQMGSNGRWRFRRLRNGFSHSDVATGD